MLKVKRAFFQFYSLFCNFCKNFDNFFFKNDCSLKLASFRFLTYSIVFAQYVFKLLSVKLFYFEKGLLNPELAKEIFESSFVGFYFANLFSNEMSFLFLILILILLFILAMGLRSSFLSFIVFLFHTYFMQRNFLIIYGADFLISAFLFYLIFVKGGGHLNFFKFFLFKQSLIQNESAANQKNTNFSKYLQNLLDSVSFRLIQIQICIMYFYTGLYKARGDSWWEGTAFWESLTFKGFVYLETSILLNFPELVAVFTYLAFLFELYFPMAVWLPFLRRYFLLAGVFLHIGIALLLGPYFFSSLVLISYILFLKKEEIKWFFVKIS